jgi:hypothetical protein
MRRALLLMGAMLVALLLAAGIALAAPTTEGKTINCTQQSL